MSLHPRQGHVRIGAVSPDLTPTGPKKAALVVAQSILVAAYYILRDGVPYRELGSDYFDHIGTTRLLTHHVRRLEALGVKVTVESQAAAA